MLVTDFTMADLYFQGLTQALHRASVCTPTLVVDKERLDRNIDHLITVLNRGFDYRIVAKSLPSIPMLQYLMRRTGSVRLMSFHLPFLMTLVEQIPASDILMGKPMPICAARHFYAWHSQQTHSLCFAPELQLQWLIDTPERLKQYEMLAKELNVKMRISLEVDVGLHRGGFKADQNFVETLEHIKHSPWLTLSGLMGYEAHISKIPDILGGARLAFNAVRERYQQFVTLLSKTLGAQALEGSSTYPLYDAGVRVATEIATASALVKPTDFDVETLTHHLPAAFIAAPVLKRVHKPEIPEAPILSRVLRAFGKLPKEGCYIYGGNWLATPCYPDARPSELLGRSSNQEFYELATNSNLQVDDYLFFRPKQSESVFLQFGQIALYEQGNIVDWWPVLQYPEQFPQYRLQRAARLHSV
jgi:D-serine deaminase-like pyridoxal phosphate-dependent protein